MSDVVTRLVFLPFAEATSPPKSEPFAVVRVYSECWWLVDPQHGLVFTKRQYGPPTPLCSLYKTTSALLYWAKPFEVRKFSTVFVPVDHQHECVVPG